MANMRRVFANHVLEIVNKPTYNNWKFIVHNKPGYGITATGPDKFGIMRTLKVTPSGSYPNTPPVVKSEPPYSDDICWDSSGLLHYTNFKRNSSWENPWEKSVQTNVNPLFALLIELLQKYKLGV